MHIDWKNLTKNNKLDYFAITVSNGMILRTQPYYLIEDKNSVKVGNPVWDCLLSDGYLKCFSYGINENSGEKFDFLILSDNRDTIYHSLVKEFAFFKSCIIEKFNSFLNQYSLNFVNHIIGFKRAGDKKNICLYFRTNKYFSYDNARIFISNLINYFSFDKDKNFPEIGVGSHLHMVALDFSENEFKLKFYFKFNGDYDFNMLENCFINTNNSKIILDIKNSNGRIDFFQVAISASKNNTYNFYMREN